MSQAPPSTPSNRSSTPPQSFASSRATGAAPASPIPSHDHQALHLISPQPARVLTPPCLPSPKGPLDSTGSLLHELDALDNDPDAEDIGADISLKELAETIRSLRNGRQRVFRRAKWRRHRDKREEEAPSKRERGGPSTVETMETMEVDQVEEQPKPAGLPATTIPMDMDGGGEASTATDRKRTGKIKKRKRARDDVGPYTRQPRPPPTSQLTTSLMQRARIARQFPSSSHAVELPPADDPNPSTQP